MRENKAVCSWGGEYMNFPKFIHRPHIKNSSWEFGKMRRVKRRSGAWGFQISRDPRKTFKEGEEHGNVRRGRNSHGDVRYGRGG